jgi:hypothetical protein
MSWSTTILSSPTQRRHTPVASRRLTDFCLRRNDTIRRAPRYASKSYPELSCTCSPAFPGQEPQRRPLAASSGAPGDSIVMLVGVGIQERRDYHVREAEACFRAAMQRQGRDASPVPATRRYPAPAPSPLYPLPTTLLFTTQADSRAAWPCASAAQDSSDRRATSPLPRRIHNLRWGHARRTPRRAA